MEVSLYDEDAGTDLESDSYYYPKSIEKQIVASKEIIEEHAPEKLIVFGGDCLVAQTPLDYLNGKYEKLGVLWFDAHPDISTPKQMNESHAMVLGNLIGGGADDLAKHVENPMDPAQFMYIGLVEETLSDFEREAVDKHQIPVINSQNVNILVILSIFTRLFWCKLVQATFTKSLVTLRHQHLAGAFFLALNSNNNFEW
ncbi:arginase family protein [Aerococcaceae bacterium DSM 111022]|nr:arginase family protein [Aerococcaceae bacterium DSM 111022]